ncbi:MAG: hypothetical protein Q9170_005357 [Blastenia crenularia]
MMSSTMEEVEVTLVAPLTVSEQPTVTLTALDNVVPRRYSRFVLVISNVGGASTTKRSEIKSQLVAGLEATIKEIPLLTGKVASSPEQRGRLCVVPGAGFKLYERDLSGQSSWSYSELEKKRFPLASLDGTILSPVAADPVDTEPDVALAQINYLDHGILLTFVQHHAVFDISCAATVLKAWARHTATASAAIGDPLDNKQMILSPTALDRTPLLQSSGLQSEAAPAKLPQYRIIETIPPSSEAQKNAHPEASSLPPMTAKVFHFRSSSITELKAMGQLSQPSVTFISTNDVLSAFVWLSITKARLATALPETIPSASALGFAVDGRRRLSPPLPADFMGNAIVYGYASVPMTELMSALPTSIPVVAAAVRSSINETTDARIREIIAFINTVPRVTDIVPGFNSFLGPDVAITNWNNTGLGDLQWGSLGQVRAMRIPKTGFDGLCIVLPKCGEGLDVIVCLKEDSMEQLCDDDSWRLYTEVIG